MKVIQSFWSKPSINHSDDPNSRFKGGWLGQKYAFYSQALSCLTFKEFYGEVELYTDNKGKETFIDLLGLPYTKTHITLNEIDTYNPKLWALGKIFTYAKQDTPFIHVDSDVYIWKKLPETLTNSPLFSQNLEVNFPAYEKALNDIFIHFDWIPAPLINSVYKHKEIRAFNAGIIGGSNYDFFKKLKHITLQFINENEALLEKIDVGIFNTIFEQQLGYAIAEKNNFDMHYLLEDVEPDFSKVINFHTVPFDSQFVHCIGYAKKSIFACEQLEARLHYHYPNFYNQLNIRLQKHFPETLINPIKPERLQYLFTMYNWLENITSEAIFNTTFELNPNAKFIEKDDGYYVSYILPQNQKQHEEKLEDWQIILLYFETATSIKDLYDELIQDDDFLKQIDRATLQPKLTSFIMDKCILLEVLVPTQFLATYNEIYTNKQMTNSIV